MRKFKPHGEGTYKDSRPVLEPLADFCLLVIPGQGPHR